MKQIGNNTTFVFTLSFLFFLIAAYVLVFGLKSVYGNPMSRTFQLTAYFTKTNQNLQHLDLYGGLFPMLHNFRLSFLTRSIRMTFLKIVLLPYLWHLPRKPLIEFTLLIKDFGDYRRYKIVR